MCESISLVIVTCLRDLSLVDKCLRSFLKYGNIFKKVIIVLNDNAPLSDLFFVCSLPGHDYNRVQVVSPTELYHWQYKFDWWSQQFFKLHISKRVDTPWYLLLDSDDLLTREVVLEDLFYNQVAKCRVESTQFMKTQHTHLIPWVENAFRKWGNPMDSFPTETMGNLTPFIMNTSIAKELSEQITPECFLDHDSRSLEFYYYYAFLQHKGVFEKLYKKTPPIEFSWVDKQK